MRLLSSDSPTTRPLLRRISKTEKGRRKKRLEMIASLHHDELSRQGSLGDLGRGQREHVVFR